MHPLPSKETCNVHVSGDLLSPSQLFISSECINIFWDVSQSDSLLRMVFILARRWLLLEFTCYIQVTDQNFGGYSYRLRPLIISCLLPKCETESRVVYSQGHSGGPETVYSSLPLKGDLWVIWASWNNNSNCSRSCLVHHKDWRLTLLLWWLFLT